MDDVSYCTNGNSLSRMLKFMTREEEDDGVEEEKGYESHESARKRV